VVHLLLRKMVVKAGRFLYIYLTAGLAVVVALLFQRVSVDYL